LDLHQLLDVLTAVHRGDFTVRMPFDKEGLAGKVCDKLNSIIELNERITNEFSHTADVVGKQGKISQRAAVHGAGGSWAVKVEALNGLIGDLVQPTVEVMRVIASVAEGNLSQKMGLEIDGRPLTGEFLSTARTVNTMVDQLRTFGSEVTRVAREVGTEGKLGGQAKVEGVAGTWKDLTDSVNMMAANLTGQVRNIAEVTTAVAKGDLAKKITVDARGEVLQLKDTINIMVDQLNSFASEVTRVAREVGTDGNLGGQARVGGVSGVWKELTDNVNMMAKNLTDQVRNIAEVTTAVANGDLSTKITVNVRGEILDLKKTINRMVDQLSTFASEATRVAREVGTEGKLGGQAEVPGVAGTWKDLTDNVNMMAANLTGQVRNIADVSTAIAKGDLSKKITVNVRGEVLELKETINTMVDQLSTFASEVTRVAREVGIEGNLGGQAEVPGVAGTWKDLTDNVNMMAANLTGQVRNIAEVTTAVARGDLSKKITVDVRGEVAGLKGTINTMVDQLSTFASEVTRVAREVGTQGRLGGQAQVPGVAGTWKDLTDNVNMMAANLTDQVRNIADVATAIARGDLSKKITVDVRGEVATLKETINTMVGQLGTFASEVTRVAREVGTEGKLGGQAQVPDVGGTWKDLTDNVNMMAANLTGQVRNIAEVTTAVANGDLSKKITVDVRGEVLQLKETINTMVDQLNSFASEVTRVAREVGTEGNLGGQARVEGVAGTWKDLTDNVNLMAANLTGQVRNIAAVTTAVANGDLSKKITVDVRGEILALKNTVNIMVDQLNSFASEVTRVAREVGTDGKLGGQAQVKGVSGVWKELTDNVNVMGTNLTDQVRGIAKVVTAVARGDLHKKLTVQAKGEIWELADTINAMTDTLATFADQVTTVAREVGVEGKLGAQANVPGAAGTWRDLTDNVNRLAANLTTQVRAIAEVATAVTEGDLSRSITVEAAGEVASLKDNINEMIANLRDTTRVNTEQDWLKTNVAHFTRLLQGQRDIQIMASQMLSELAPVVNLHAGLFYLTEQSEDATTGVKLRATYGFKERKNLSNNYRAGEGLVGQAVLERQRILLTEVPNDYIRISSGLGDAAPRNIVVLPVMFEGNVLGVLELASFNQFSRIHLGFMEQLTESLGIVLNTIAATMRTEELLKQSQSMAGELQSQQQELKDSNRRLEEHARTLQDSELRLKEQQEELQQANEELEEKADLLARQNAEVEKKNKEIERARVAVEEKAEQLALTSKYKSEFLANMSHELRTPLNSLLLLSKMLADNVDGNLTGKQEEYADTIYAAGNDLLALINDILDLSKIESGTVEVALNDVPFTNLSKETERTFAPLAEKKGLAFKVGLGSGLPASIRTDEKRLHQVLKNLLSNALKFTEEGEVSLHIAPATRGWSAEHEGLNRASKVIAFTVKDTGIGIPEDKHRIIFESFQQADGGTSRSYGGVGLGLAISREIANLLGGELILQQSNRGQGSTFVLFLPDRYVARSHPGSRRGASATPSPDADVIAQYLKKTASEEAKIDIEEFVENQIDDDRSVIKPTDRVLLVIDADPENAKIVIETARERGFKAIFASEAMTALKLALEFRPDAISLQLNLAEKGGLALLDRLKHNASTRHIPVHVFSSEEERHRAMQLGALSHLQMPTSKEQLEQVFQHLHAFVDKPVRRLLVVEDNEIARKSIVELIGNGDVRTTAVGSGAEALELLATEPFDCMVLDLTLSDIDGFQVIESMRNELQIHDLPIIIYTARDLTAKEQTRLRDLAQSVIVKDVKSPERLLAETTLFLHRVESELPEAKRRTMHKLHREDPDLHGKKILIVDDDVRNIFALTSFLERHHMVVINAENGREAIEMLSQNADTDVVLMDIMMPEMDGYETIRAIRNNKSLAKVPIIAVTAKAMKGDREESIEAGASDYISKPVDTEQLISLLRVWLFK